MENNEIDAIADRISDKLIAIVKKQLGEPEAHTGPRWVKASVIKIVYGRNYYAKWLDGKIHATGWFQESDGTFFWNVPGYIPIAKHEYEHLYLLDESATPAGINQDAHEKEIIMQAFDKVRQIFEGRQWVMDGRGSYPYNDDRYKEEVRYMYDEFDQVVKDTWGNIKSKSIEYKEWIIDEYLQKDHPAIHDVLRRLGYQKVDESTPAGREEGTDVFVPCAEGDPDRCGGYTSDDGRSLCYVKVQHVPVSALKQKEGE